ncbi:Sodium-dependent neutral amino acid transporter B(0)AT3 [Stylophora pistillata]|uniref:Sodium-dependent neutral amino acid transporter B(0)AT3 n=1 Tax=Stylophora pistillata TaxID=50429 RepID=A0A2B4SR08_STYPI|nr:Sodium-dependent neutral amino acid transporter B(0)AT3 [Stylophora pistillata]
MTEKNPSADNSATYKAVSTTAILASDEDDHQTTVEVIETEKVRLGWDNKVQFLLSAIGFAVGLGNVWRFPWLCQKNGGGAFLIPYFVMLIFEGIPIFYLELSIGQRLRQGAINVWSTVCPYLGGVGIATTVVCILVGSYYNVVIAWVLFYFVQSFQSPLPWAECPRVAGLNSTELTMPTECYKSSPTAYFYHRETLMHANRIEESAVINWKLAVALVVAWVLAYLCIIKSIQSSGKWDRLLDPLVWLDAATQIFFSLGLAFGTMVAYASYNPIHQNTLRDTITISVANCMTSLFAGIVVFSILGFRATYMMENCEANNAKLLESFNATHQLNTTGLSSSNITSGIVLPKCDLETFLTDAASGPGLVFIAFTDAINQMPGATFWSLLFFLMLLTLGLDSLFGALESVTTALQDVKGFGKLRREILSGLLCITGLCIGLPMVTYSGEYILQMFDSFAGNLPLLLIAICECVGVCYFYGITRFSDDIEYMTGSRPNIFWKICWMLVTPVAMLVILIASIVLMSQGKASYYAWNKEMATYEKVPYPGWAVFIAVILILMSVLFIPGVAIARYFGIVKYQKLKPVPLKEAEAKSLNNDFDDTNV